LWMIEPIRTCFTHRIPLVPTDPSPKHLHNFTYRRRWWGRSPEQR
jgi:hypothetical protein